LRALFDLYRANLSALWAYKPRIYAGKVTLFRSGASTVDSSAGWMSYAANLEVVEIESDHYSIVNGPPVQVLATHLGEMLNDGHREAHKTAKI
jgi:thioesterase domain-containing protein